MKLLTAILLTSFMLAIPGSARSDFCSFVNNVSTNSFCIRGASGNAKTSVSLSPKRITLERIWSRLSADQRIN